MCFGCHFAADGDKKARLRLFCVNNPHLLGHDFRIGSNSTQAMTGVLVEVTVMVMGVDRVSE